MLHLSENPKGAGAIGGWRWVWAATAVFFTVCLTSSSVLSERQIPSSSHYKRRSNDRHLGSPAITTTTIIAVQESRLPPLADDTDEEESLVFTTSPAPADTLNSPLQVSYLPVTPSISPTSRGTIQGKAFVRPLRRRLSQRNQQLLNKRPHDARGPWRSDSERGLLRWPLQVLQEVSGDNPKRAINADDTDRTLRWWVTNEPQLTLTAPETTQTQKPQRHNVHQIQIPRTTHIISQGSQERDAPFHNQLEESQQVEGPPPRATPPSSSPTIQPPPPPFPAPTTLAEDPAVLQAPHDLLTINDLRQPRWFTLDRFFRMITVGVDGECEGGEGRLGVCMLDGACRSAGGTPSSSCIYGYGNCCIEYKASCGLDVRANRTYWVSPTTGTHPVVTRGGSCILRVFKTSSNICHIRLDMRVFKLLGPQQGSCLRDRLVVSGHNINAFIPKICGENKDQHMYIDVDTVTGPIELNINTVGEGFTRNWEILVTQIPCSSPQRPPGNCLQYYTGPQGAFSSFNYLQGGPSQYLNNLNYAVCLRKEAGFCSIVYDNTVNGVKQDFEIVNFRIGPSLATSVVPVGEAGVGLIQCPDDYLIMAGTRLCGDRLNDGSTNPQPTNSAPVTDSTNGPFTVQFITNTESVGQGFRLHYQQYPC
ncbi:uncharacterized protein [Macrobrachium rosenbergii]|uniref:uncharacterized protein isoform X2 n=1 Tax=Macrobrachium rosenbergii TaxID=79674 RepID=UPI0034D62543